MRYPTHVRGVQAPGRASAARIGQTCAALEGILRSCNNLLERMHHSYFMYLQPSLWTFITIEVYILAPVVFIAALLLSAARLLIDARASIKAGAATAAQLQHGEEPTEGAGHQAACHPESADPAMLSVGLGQAGRAACGMVATHAICVCAGAVVALIQQASAAQGKAPELLASAVLVPLGLFSAVGGACSTSLCGSASTSPEAESPAVARTEPSSVMPDWQVFKAFSLLATAVLMAGALFVNWCAPYPSCRAVMRLHTIAIRSHI